MALRVLDTPAASGIRYLWSFFWRIQMEWVLRILVLGVCMFAMRVWALGRHKVNALGLHLAIAGILAILGWFFLLTFARTLPANLTNGSSALALLGLLSFTYGITRILR